MLSTVLSPDILKRRLRLVLPDHTESRGDRHLLVWKDDPHWMVVDQELAELLRGLDGTRTAAELVRASAWGPAERRAAAGVLTGLSKRGYLQEVERGREVGTALREPRVPAIESVTVNVTRRCNQACATCYNGDPDRGARGEEIGAEEITRLLRDAARLLPRHPTLVLLGGEPLMRPDLVLELAEWAVRRRFDAIASTNGTIVTEPFARGAARAGLQVQVSLDGPEPATNDVIRGRGSFDRAVAGVRTLVAHRVHTVLSCVCHEDNLASLESYHDLGRSLGVNEVRFIPLKVLGRARSGDLRPVRLVTLLREARALFARRPELRRLAGRDAFSILGSTCRLSVRRQSCGSGRRTFLLDSDGALYPCVNTRLPEFRFGGIRDAGFDFETAWRRSHVLAEYRSRTSVERENGGCRDCVVRHWCLGGCRGETYAATGRLEDRSPSCDDLRAAVLEMFWTISEVGGTFDEERRYC